jgi:hypothetical protein
MYAFNITRLRRYFPPERLHVMLYEDLLADRHAVLRGFYTHLGVDPDFHCDLALADVNPDPPLMAHERHFPAEMRQAILAELRDDILQLQDILGRDLSHWLDDSLTATTPYCNQPR